MSRYAIGISFLVCCCFFVWHFKSLWSKPQIQVVNPGLVLCLPQTNDTEYRLQLGFLNNGQKSTWIEGVSLHQRSTFLNDRVFVGANNHGFVEIAVKKEAVPVDRFGKFTFEFQTANASTPKLSTSVYLRRESN